MCLHSGITDDVRCLECANTEGMESHHYIVENVDMAEAHDIFWIIFIWLDSPSALFFFFEDCFNVYLALLFYLNKNNLQSPQ